MLPVLLCKYTVFLRTVAHTLLQCKSPSKIFCDATDQVSNREQHRVPTSFLLGLDVLTEAHNSRLARNKAVFCLYFDQETFHFADSCCREHGAVLAFSVNMATRTNKGPDIKKEPDRVLIVGKPDSDRCDNKVVSARYTLLTFFPIVRCYHCALKSG